MSERKLPRLENGPYPCPQCGYDLTGLIAPSGGELGERLPTLGARCPECGATADLSQICAAGENPGRWRKVLQATAIPVLIGSILCGYVLLGGPACPGVLLLVLVLIVLGKIVHRTITDSSESREC